MLNRDLMDGYESPPNGKAPDHPGDLAVHLQNERDRARERAAREAAGRHRAIAAETGRAAIDGRPPTPGGDVPAGPIPTTTAGPAIPTPTAVAEHAAPEQPRAGRTMGNTPAEYEERRDDPAFQLALKLRQVTHLDEAIALVRVAILSGTVASDPALLARCDRAEQLYRVHYLDYLAELRGIVRAHAVDAFRLARMHEWAEALETGRMPAILEGRP